MKEIEGFPLSGLFNRLFDSSPINRISRKDLESELISMGAEEDDSMSNEDNKVEGM